MIAEGVLNQLGCQAQAEYVGESSVSLALAMLDKMVKRLESVGLRDRQEEMELSDVPGLRSHRLLEGERALADVVVVNSM